MASAELPELVAPTDYAGLDLLPADFSYRQFDVRMSERKHPTERLLRMSRSLNEDYDCLLLDCPPGMSLLSENVLRAADAVIVPTLPTPLSLRMLEQLFDLVAQAGWSDLRLLPFFSMVDRRKSLHEEIIAATRQRFPMMLTTEVPYWSEIRTDGRASSPDSCLRATQPRRARLSSLWSEIAARLRE